MLKTSLPFALAALFSTLPAQSHSTSILHNPATRTTRLTFEVRAAAGSIAILYGSGRATSGLALPPYGTLYLDPATGLVNLFAIPVGASGAGSLSLTMPTAVVDGLMLVTQAVVVTGSTIRLTNWAGSGVRMTPTDGAAEGAAGTYDRETRTLKVSAYGQVGAVVKIWEKEGTHAVQIGVTGQIQPDGCWMPLPIGNIDLRDGDSIIVQVGNDSYELKFN